MNQSLALKYVLMATLLVVSPALRAQTAPPAKPAAPQPAAPQKMTGAAIDPAVATGVVPPAGYVIGPEDILSVVFWREKELSAEVMVRPDGRISIPLLNDVEAAGLTPEQLRERVMAQAQRLVEDANVTIIVKQINSRRVFITGQVAKPGHYPLGGPTTVLQLIATAGGLLEYADASNIVVMRTEKGAQVTHRFNYKDVIRQRNVKQNIELKPNDTIVVP